ncbi:hypothetical protein J4437_05235 [Candidatus Woesearchaeota archaeon]|nr:hypothetical protein [Candidatus Woesearchaeota archaeon]
MFKKGQVTVFIIIGIVILLLSAVSIYFFQNFTTDGLTSKISNTQPIKDYIEGCLNNQLNEVIYLIALQGGYYKVPPDSLDFGVKEFDFSLQIPYYLNNGVQNIPNKEDMEKEISSALLDRVDDCLDLTIFNEYYFFIDKEKINFDVSLSNNKVGIIANIPISLSIMDSEIDDSINQNLDSNLKAKSNLEAQREVVSLNNELVDLSRIDITAGKERKIISLDRFQASTFSNLVKLIYASSNFTAEQNINGNLICLTCLSELANESNLRVNMQEVENEDSYIVIYSLRDNPGTMIFNFAHKFALSTEEGPLSIEDIDSLQAKLGEEFVYAVKAVRGDFTFYDNTDLFDIDSTTGIIRFTPTKEESGTYFVKVGIKNNDGDFDEDIFTLQITGEENSIITEDIPYLVGKMGEHFSYSVSASSSQNLALTYLDNSDLFEIDPFTGSIEFIPESAGEYDFLITITDEKNNMVTEEGTLLVIG